MAILKEKIKQDNTESKSCITVFETHEEAERAVKSLEKFGYDMKKLSIVGTDYRTEENVIGYYNIGNRVKFWGAKGAFWGGVWGILFGSAFFFIPGIGSLVLAGPIVGMLVGGLESAVLVGSMTALGAALYSMGIPKDSVLEYELALKAHKFLLITHGTHNEIDNAREILKQSPMDKEENHNAKKCCGQ